MGRFFLTLLLAVGIGVAIAWGLGLGPFAKQESVIAEPLPEAGKAVANRDLGGPLFALPKPPAFAPLEDEPPRKPGTRRPRQFPFPDGSVHPLDKHDVAAPKAGVVSFVGQQMDVEDPMALKALPTIEIFVGGRPKTVAYKPWIEGNIVEFGQMLALIDPTRAENERLYKREKIAAALADWTAAIFTAKEAQARLNRLDQLKRGDVRGGIVTAEEYSAAVLTKDKYYQEEIAKKAAWELAKIEELQALADLRLHEVRNKLPGKSIIKIVYKHMNEGVKDLEPVMHVYSLSKLRLEALVDARYADLLKNSSKMRVLVEPVHEMAPEPLPLSKAHRGDVNSVAVSYRKDAKEGPLFVSGSEDRTVCVWRPASGEAPEALYHDAPVRVVACSPPASGRRLCLAGCANGRVYVWDLDNLQAAPHKLEAHGDAVTAVAFSPDGKFFATAGQDRPDRALRLWSLHADKAEPEPLYPFDHEHGADNPHQDTVTALHFTPQGKLVSASRDNTLRVWALHEKGAKLEGEPVHGRGGSVTHPGVSADGSLMVFDQGRTLQLFSVKGHRPMAVVKNPATATPFETMALFSPDGSLLLTAGANEGRMQLWRTPTSTSRAYELRQLVTSERLPVTCASFSPKGDFLVSGTRDGFVHLWAMPERKQLENHRIRVDPQGQPLRLTNVDRSLDGSKLRVTVHLENPPTDEYPHGRLMPGNRVTLVIEQE
jgi:WD40 repeat protein